MRGPFLVWTWRTIRSLRSTHGRISRTTLLTRRDGDLWWRGPWRACSLSGLRRQRSRSPSLELLLWRDCRLLRWGIRIVGVQGLCLRGWRNKRSLSSRQLIHQIFNRFAFRVYGYRSIPRVVLIAACDNGRLSRDRLPLWLIGSGTLERIKRRNEIEHGSARRRRALLLLLGLRKRSRRELLRGGLRRDVRVLAAIAVRVIVVGLWERRQIGRRRPSGTREGLSGSDSWVGGIFGNISAAL